jgi:hypothetical protein
MKGKMFDFTGFIAVAPSVRLHDAATLLTCPATEWN